MRATAGSAVLRVRAIAGLHVVIVAWDFAPGAEGRKKGLLGFALERAELADGQVVERYYIRGIKRFRHKDDGLPPGTPVPTSEHPVQTFQWGDYTAKPEVTYRYRVVPVYGKPKLLDLDHAASATVEVTTEAEVGQSPGRPRHEIYFNRGAAGSQAYARRFSGPPDQTKPASEQMKWLSRGLFEGLTGFLARAAGPDAADYRLRAMFYEFQYLPVGRAFAAARKAGADVAVRYEAQSYKEHNEAMIAAAGIKGVCKPLKAREGIRHNKFVVLVHHDVPVAVWTGSTNISAGGIFGHSNVGHVVWDRDVAERFLGYWGRLAASDVTSGALSAANRAEEATPAGLPPADPVQAHFSPRDAAGVSRTLQWYADLLGAAKRVVCMTFPFNLDPVFADVLARDDEVLRYAVFDKDPHRGDIEAVNNAVIAVGSKLEKDDLRNFRAEVLTGFNRNLYIHDKFMLVDPLGSDPIVVTGSANFSGASQRTNDENMLVVRGDARVADVYFGEFMRIFDHLYARYLVAKIQQAGGGSPEAGFLKDDDAWVAAHFREGGRKALRRAYFVEG